MSDKHIKNFKYRDFFRDEYSAGDAGVNEMIEDTKNLLRYVFDDAPEMRERIIDNIYVIAGGDTKNQLRLLNTLMAMASSFVLEDGTRRHMSCEELEASFPIRNMAMNAIVMAIDISAKRIIQMQDSIHNLTEALAISTKEKSNDKG